MLLILSPSKTMNMEPSTATPPLLEPLHLEQAKYLTQLLKGLSTDDLQALMKTSDKLTLETQEKLHRIDHVSIERSQAAILAYTGQVYAGLDARTINSETILNNPNDLIILSGLYGILRPYDAIQEYRLEMGAKLENDKGKNLYAFWKDSITASISSIASANNHQYLINLASNEYSKTIDKKKLGMEILDIEFKEKKNDTYKIVATFAKKARGMLARYILKNKLVTIEEIKLFDMDGYAFNTDLSTESTYVFTR